MSCVDCECAKHRNCGDSGRRRFLGVVAAGLAVLVAPVRALAARKVAIRLSRVPVLQRVGGFAILGVLGKQILFIRDGADSVRALTAFCSHKRTRIGYDPVKKRVICSAHGSWFTLEGVVKKGPATKNLSPIYWCKLDKARQRILLKLP